MDSYREQRRTWERQSRGPAWRRQVAWEAANSGQPLQQAIADRVVIRAADFCRRLGGGPAGTLDAKKKYPDIAAAEAAWNDPLLRERLQLLVLGDVPAEECARRLGLRAGVVQAIEDLHFDVRPALSATAWVIHKAIGAGTVDGDKRLVARMKFAYFGGPFAARALLDGDDHLPSHSADRLSMATVALALKAQEVVEMPRTPDQQIQFLKNYGEIRVAEQQIALEREKLTARMQRWAERCEIARARIESKRRRPRQQGDVSAQSRAAGPADSRVTRNSPPPIAT